MSARDVPKTGMPYRNAGLNITGSRTTRDVGRAPAEHSCTRAHARVASRTRPRTRPWAALTTRDRLGRDHRLNADSRQ